MQAGDSARPETISHLRKNGFPRRRHQGAGLPRKASVPRALHREIHGASANTIDELTLYSYKTDPAGRVVEGAAGATDKDNHVD
jgi:phage terminase large subunit